MEVSLGTGDPDTARTDTPLRSARFLTRSVGVGLQSGVYQDLVHRETPVYSVYPLTLFEPSLVHKETTTTFIKVTKYQHVHFNFRLY